MNMDGIAGHSELTLLGRADGLGDLGPGTHPELVEEPAHVRFDRLLGQEQLRRDLLVGPAHRDEIGDLAFAPGEAREPVAAGRPAPSRRRLHAPAAELARGLVAEADGAAG